MIQFNYSVVWIWHISASMRQKGSVPPCVKVVSLCVKAGSCLCGFHMFVSLYGKLRRVSVVLTPPPPDSSAFWEKKKQKNASLWREGGRERGKKRGRWRGEEGGEKMNLDLVSSHNTSPWWSQRVQRALLFAERVESRLNCWTACSPLKQKAIEREEKKKKTAIKQRPPDASSELLSPFMSHSRR